ncbi:putative urea ABC transporter substrate-binding protein [Acuticoccus mangrovi]|uniref:ABC transporter substrate-binding protein n=1 Tax=Acuticoccus mangrovi TaxID=2796142 RepID=A0A934IFZ9_9HYPH|nr:putative urea ABC transporter substrate-binding protein [Acuticoccus mangrovi]MBJ3775969.1 ABC transporter substrate-binding protein [Acuticoccus mangrovi]
MKRLIIALAAGAALLTAPVAGALAQEKTYRVGYNIYVGFMPYGWMAETGILDKWAEKYGVKIEMIQVNDYVGGINQFVAGDLDAMAVASMDGLTIPAAGGVDTTIALVGDYSNGNDGILSKTLDSVTALKGETIHLFELTVSHYLLSRALEENGLSLRDVNTVNITDADIAPAYIGSDEVKHAVAWNPMLLAMKNGVEGSTMVFDSSSTPEEIVDVMLFHTETVDEDPAFIKAVVGAWYEAMEIMSGGDDAAEKMIAELADMSGGSVEDYKAQLDSTKMYYTPAEALEFMTSDQHKTTWDFVRKFSFEVGLFGESAPDENFVGIEFPDGSVLGDENNVKLRINSTFTKMAVDGEL